MSKTLLNIFFGAVAIRWAYSIGMFLALGNDGLAGIDSSTYLGAGSLMAQQIAAGSVHGWDWLGNPFVMPLVTYVVALNYAVFGEQAPLSYVLCQGVLDAGTCLLVYGIAYKIAPRFAPISALAAALNPTQIVLSGLVYTDTMFTFFVAVFLFGALAWLARPTMASASIICIGLLGAALTRIAIAPWAVALLGFLLIVEGFRRQLGVRQIAQVAIVAVVFTCCIATIVARNVARYDAWALTPQSGMHLGWWVVPLVMEAETGVPWQHNFDEILKRTRERYGPETENPFVDSKRYTTVAMDELRRLGPIPIVKAWTTGAAINVGSPAVTLSPPVLRLPHTGFYGTQGNTAFAKIYNFLFHSDNAPYAWILLIGIAGLAIVRLVQLVGLVAAVRSAGGAVPLLLLCGWCGYILAISGPVASPKYRLPMEPVLDVLSGAGIATLAGRRRLKMPEDRLRR